MTGWFSGPLRVFSRLTYPQKFLLISLVFLLPLLSFYPLVVQQLANIENYGTHEVQGTLYLRPLQRLLRDVLAHQFLVEQIRVGEARQEDLGTLQDAIARDFGDLQVEEGRYGSVLGTRESLALVSERWSALRARTSDLGSVSPDESQRLHAGVIASLRDFINDVGDTSYLILDPDLDTYYAMDTVLLQLPEIYVLLADTRDLSVRAAHSKALTPEERAQLIVLIGQLRARVDGMQRNLRERGFPRNASGHMAPLIEPSLKSVVASTGDLASLAETQLVNAGSVSVDPAVLVTAANMAITDAASLYDGTSRALETGVELRRRTQSNQLLWSLALAVGGVVLGLVLGLGTMRAISRPLEDLTRAARRLAEGDLSVRVPVTSEDEVGQVALAFNHFVDTLNTIVRAIVDSATKLSSATTEISAASNEMAAGADSQTQQVIRTSSAMEEISATIKEVARNAQATARATESAVARARQGTARVRSALESLERTNDSLQKLRQRSAEIDQVVRLIAEIAATTNILALNAAIEAAGAGVAGARFDVVAEEIRKLAGRTAESTARIGVTVAEIQGEMAATATRMSDTAAEAEEIGQSLSDIAEAINSANDMMAMISSSTTQQARAAEQVAESLQLITQVSQQTAEATRETSLTIDDLSGLAHGMTATVNQFRVG